MGAYGPFTAVAGTLQTCQLGPLDSKSLLVQNRSRFDLGISLANHVPPVVSQFAGGEWDVVCPAGDRIAVDIGEIEYVRGAWMGNAYILPIDPSPNQALSGVISANPVYYLRTSPLPASVSGYSGAGTGVDITNQPRVIALPIGMIRYFTQRILFSATADIHIITLTAAQIAAGSYVFYQYGFYIYPDTGVSGAIDFTLFMQFYAGAGGTGATVGGPITMFTGAIAANNANSTMTPFMFFPPNPLVVANTIPAGAQSFKTQLAHNAGANLTVNIYSAANLDSTNIVPIADIGNTVFYNSSQAHF